MNRIVLIGNGFDLAHGMPTSYKHFIEDYWQGVMKSLHEEENRHSKVFSNNELNIENYSGWNYEDIKSYIEFLEKIRMSHHCKTKVVFKNLFLENLLEKLNLTYWVDIENEYYTYLKELLSHSEGNKFQNIDKLNEDFRVVKKLLEEYLIKIEGEFKKTYIKNVYDKMLSTFNLNDFTLDSFNKKVEIEETKFITILGQLNNEDIFNEHLDYSEELLISRIGNKDPKNEIKTILLSDDATGYFNLKPDDVMLLNFNYTSTEKLYLESNNTKGYLINHIHGQLSNKNNPIIFGYGDELDDDYLKIEKLNNNEFLENIKSIKYSETNNYKKMLEFIESGTYQVLVMGHSCGTSDRTLLNTIFEHDNCVSIKPYYHQKDNGSDNYSDLVRNISRNFNDKRKMRERVVNKTYCEPLIDIKVNNQA